MIIITLLSKTRIRNITQKHFDFMCCLRFLSDVLRLVAVCSQFTLQLIRSDNSLKCSFLYSLLSLSLSFPFIFTLCTVCLRFAASFLQIYFFFFSSSVLLLLLLLLLLKSSLFCFFLLCLCIIVRRSYSEMFVNTYVNPQQSKSTSMKRKKVE